MELKKKKGNMHDFRKHTRLDKIRNETIREKVRVASIEDKMKAARLKWFAHIKRRDINAPVWRFERIDLPK